MLKRFILWFAVVLLVFVGAISIGPAASPERIAFASVRKVTSAIDGVDAACSAVVVEPGIALMAEHCMHIPELRIDGLVVSENIPQPGKDMAKATVPGLDCPCAPIAPKSAIRNDHVYAVGFAFGGPKVTTRGEVQEHVKDNDKEFMMAVLPVVSGMSGGGVFNKRGQLLGTVVGAHGTLAVYSEL